MPLSAALTVVALAVTLASTAVAGSIGKVLAPGRPTAAAAGKPITIASRPTGPPIPAGFVGLSVEYRSLEAYAGGNPQAINPLLVQLLRNLAPSQNFELRVGGDSTDQTWVPYGHKRRPDGVRFDVTPRWLGVLHALTNALSARVIIGIDLRAGNTGLAAAEARALTNAVGRQRVEALEIGNEPELYGSFAWYVLHGQKFFNRPPNYDFVAFLRDFGSFGRALPGQPVAGPSTGNTDWMANLDRFLRAEPRVRVATLHRYPLKRCTQSVHLTAGQLLAESSSRGLADLVGRYARVAHAHHVPLRLDETGTISCGGQTGLDDTFATSLWALDTMFELARAGVDGVNVHSLPRLTNHLFSFTQSHGKWTAKVSPIYYGLAAFAQAAPPRARLLSVSGAPSGVKMWATRSSDGQVRVVLINKQTAHRATVALRVPAAGSGLVERLRAPSIRSKQDVTFGGVSFGGQAGTATVAGSARPELIAPRGGSYTITVPAASAALITFAAR